MLKQTLPHELDSEDILHYYRAVETDEHSGGPAVVSQLVLQGDNQLWTWNTDRSRGVLITHITQYPDGESDMVVSMMAGTGILEEYEEITDALLEWCDFSGCNRVIAFVRPEIWQSFRQHHVQLEELYMVIGSRVLPKKERDEQG